MRISDWSSDVCSSDLEPPRDFAHLSAIMADRDADDIGFQFVERSDMTIGLEQRNSLATSRFARCQARLVRRKYTAKMGAHTCLDQSTNALRSTAIEVKAA